MDELRIVKITSCVLPTLLLLGATDEPPVIDKPRDNLRSP